MKTIREVLNKIKEIQGIKTDGELAQLIGVPLDTMRNWLQNESIRKPLLFYCYSNHISIDEVFFGDATFSKERCEKCLKKSTCSVYREQTSMPVTTEVVGNELHISMDTTGRTQCVCTFYNNKTEASNSSTTLKNIDKISILLR
jgi:hypothetical protein